MFCLAFVIRFALLHLIELVLLLHLIILTMNILFVFDLQNDTVHSYLKISAVELTSTKTYMHNKMKKLYLLFLILKQYRLYFKY